MATRVSTDDILEAIRLALQSNPETGDGMTVLEIAAAMNPPVGEQKARKAVKRLLKEGTMENCRVHRPRMDGIITACSGYRFKT